MPLNKGIRLIENRQLVPPSHPSPKDVEWVKATGRRRRMQSSNSNEAVDSVVPALEELRQSLVES